LVNPLNGEPAVIMRKWHFVAFPTH